MPGCAVANCTAYDRKTKLSGVVYHVFPRDPALRKIWVSKCKRGDAFIADKARICSQHFTEGDYLRDLKAELIGQQPKRRLKPDAIPSVNVPGPLMESDCKNVLNNNNLVDIKIEIKEEPIETFTQVKSEYEEINDFHSETAVLSSQCLKDYCSDSEIDCNRMDSNIKIKEEPCWSESISNEIKQEMEPPSAADADLKEPASHSEVITQNLEAARLQSVCRNKDTTSCMFTNRIPEENTWAHNDSDIDKGSHLLSPGHGQTLEEPPRTLTQHKLLQKKKLHTCEVCKKSVTRLSSLNNHKLIHEGRKPHTCEICNKSFTQISYLKRHKLTHEGRRRHTCEICNKSLSLASSLKRHKLTHERKSPYSCEICNKGFSLASKLNEHKFIHTGVKPYTCEICKKSFTQVSNLKIHKLIHEGTKHHTCEICSKNFNRAYNLKVHKLIHHCIKPHICEICNKSFALASALTEHKLNHHRIKPHTCEICNKSFTLASALREHKSIHSDITRRTWVSVTNNAIYILHS